MRYFIQDHSVIRVNRSLSKLLYGYLRNMNTGIEDGYDEVLQDIEALQELLNVLEDETKDWRAKLG